jgi:roadblock/LC7 domain-containing protein
MELRQVYIIGALTNNQFVKLDTLAAYMAKIDPESNIMLAETKGDTDQMYQYYRQNFRKVLPKQFAPTYINLSPSQLY